MEKMQVAPVGMGGFTGTFKGRGTPSRTRDGWFTGTVDRANPGSGTSLDPFRPEPRGQKRVESRVIPKACASSVALARLHQLGIGGNFKGGMGGLQG